MRAKKRKFMRKGKKKVDSNLRGMFRKPKVKAEDIRADFQDPSNLQYMVSGDADFRSIEAGTYPNQLWKKSSRLHTAAGLVREAGMYKHPEFVSEAGKALDIVNARDDFSRNDVEYFNRFMQGEIAKAEKLEESRAADAVPVTAERQVRKRPGKKRAKHVEGRGLEHDPGKGLWDNFKQVATREYDRLRRAYNMLNGSVNDNADVEDSMKRLRAQYRLWDKAVEDAPADATAVQGLKAREALRKGTSIDEQEKPAAVSKRGILGRVKEMLKRGKSHIAKEKERQKRLASLEVISRTMPVIRERRQREKRLENEKKARIYGQFNLRTPEKNYIFIGSRNADDFRDAKEALKAGLGKEYTAQHLLDQLDENEINEFARKRYQGKERLENLLNLVTKKQLRNDLEQELKKAKDEVVQEREQKRLEQRKAKAEQLRKEKTDKAYQTYLSKYATEDSRRLTRDEFEEIAQTCMRDPVRGDSAFFRDSRSDATISYALPADTKARIREKAGDNPIRKRTFTGRTLKKGLYREAEKHFKQREAYDKYLAKVAGDGRELDFDNYRALSEGIQYRAGNMLEDFGFAGKGGNVQYAPRRDRKTGAVGLVDMIDRAKVQLDDRTSLTARLDDSTLRKLRERAVEKVLKNHVGSESALTSAAKKYEQMYARSLLKRRLLKKAEEHYAAQKMPEEVPVSADSAEGWTTVGSGISNSSEQYR